MLEISGTPINEDLEDGEIFDDDDDDEVVPPPKTPQVSAAEPPAATSPIPSKKRPLSPAGSDRRRRLRRITKRPREDDRPSYPRKQRRRSEDQEKNKDKDGVVDEDEWLNVTRMRSSPPGSRANNNDWDRYNHRSDEEEEESASCGNRRNRRDNFQSRRRLRSRGAGRRNGRRGGDSNICKFYLQGKCQRGSECPFPHGSHRKYELCKFYMNDCCSKKDKCLFMHNDFPCKFFHLGLKCYAGKRCKFSHTKVSPYVKQQLIKHNQSESDKHFLHNLEIISPRESPIRDHMGGRDSPHYHRSGGGGGHHHNRRQNNNRHHNNYQDRRSNSPHHSDQDERIFDRRPRPQNSLDSPYSDDERNRTPMPSPSQDNSSDRDMRSPDQELTCDYSSNSDTPPSDQKDSGIGEEMPQEAPQEIPQEMPQEILQEVSQDVPINLPPKQRELYLRIQQQQRQAMEAQNADGEDLDKEEDFRDEDWYSSDDEGGPLATILKTIKNKKPDSKQEQPVPEVLPDFDVSAVSKLLTSVRETIQKNQLQLSPQHLSNNDDSAYVNKTSQDVKRRVRDPRLRAPSSPPKGCKSPNGFATTSLPSLQNTGDVDLRLTSGTPHTQSISSTSSSLSLPADVDLRQLPFKPAPIHQAANEIDASIKSHPPILNYSLIPFPSIGKPDYSHVQPKSTTDPRLRKYAGQSVSLPLPVIMGSPNSSGITSNNNNTAHQTSTTLRDPRQRILLPNDPRRRPSLLPQPSSANNLVGHHHSSNSRDCDLRGHHPQMGDDIDLRFQQPAPNFYYDQ